MQGVTEEGPQERQRWCHTDTQGNSGACTYCADTPKVSARFRTTLPYKAALPHLARVALACESKP